MKRYFTITALMFSTLSFAQTRTLEIESDIEQDHESDQVHLSPFTPEEEEAFFSELDRSDQKRSFDYRFWNECKKPMTGNYTGYKCTPKRRLGEMLYDYMEEQLTRCVTQAAKAEGINRVDDYHVEHAGIFGDSSHSSRSLHAVGRAIDVKSISVERPSGEKIRFSYVKNGLGKFYGSLRSCWGRAVHQFNSCPLISGREDRTGSIGKENRDHNRHLHLSVPYCVAGRYAGLYYRR